MQLRWCGFDYGETVMNPFTLHQSMVIREIFRELGRAEEAEDRVSRWNRLRDSFGSPGDQAERRVRDLKQYARDRIYSEVLGDNVKAIRLFEQKEVQGLSHAKGIEEILARLKRGGASLAIVSESSSQAATSTIFRFLSAHGLGGYFDEIVTPAGRFSGSGELVGREFIGKTKKDGSIYDELVSYLATGGTAIRNAAMVGDDPVLDIEKAKARGFVTVQYTGIVNRGISPAADYVIDDWARFPVAD